MLKFRQFLLEEAAKKKDPKKKSESKWAKPMAPNTTVMVFGNFGNVSKGHEAVLQKAKSLADKQGAKLKVIASHGGDGKANKDKLSTLKKSFPDIPFELADKNIPTVLPYLKKAHEDGTKNLILVTSGPKVKHHDKIIKSYNGTPAGGYRFNSIKVVNAGDTHVSGADLADHAKNNDFKTFRSGLPTSVAPNFVQSRTMFNSIRKGLKKKAKK